MRHAKHNYNSASAGGYAHARENVAEQAAEINSRNLLIAQLRAGQHSLGEDRFWSVVGELRAQGCKL